MYKNNAMQAIHLSPGKIINENSFISKPINNDKKSSFSELTINDNQSFLSDQFGEDDKEVNVKQTRKTIIIVKLSDQPKGAGIDAKSKEKKGKKTKEKQK